MPQHDAVTALRRFGLGPKPGDMARIASDPRGYLLAGLADKASAELTKPELQPSYLVFAEAQEAQLAQRLAKALANEIAKDAGSRRPTPQMRPTANAAMPGPGTPAATTKQAAALPAATAGQVRREAIFEEYTARIERASTTDAALIERLVMFWSNHFCVSAVKGSVRGLAGAYEREAIRPHVLGRFAEMLHAVEHHPAMLIYLDNHVSTGPNSRAGKNRNVGLNENLAREILELHTLGVAGGYGQEDVTNLARILTGWVVGQLNIAQSEPGKFFYAANRHEPGAWTVAGKRYIDEGQRTGEKVLDDLARHPSTARHIATKLARHFVSEKAPAALVARLEKAFKETDGDLAAVTRALVAAPEAWAAPATKIVPPYDFTVALVRGLGLKHPPAELVRLAGLLGQPIWQVSSPKGWPDDDDAWMGPSAIRERLRIAERLARDVDRTIDPRVVASDLLGPGLGEPTRQAVARAETREQGLEMLIMSPEFLRR